MAKQEKTGALRATMNLKFITDDELDRALMGWVHKEKEILGEVVSHIAEVERRKLYLKMAFPSMFAYLTERMGYEGGSAQRRLDAARLSLEIPDLVKHLDSGGITLSQVSYFQKSVRASAENPSAQKKAELLEDIKNKSTKESQIFLAQALNVDIKQMPKIQHQKDRSVRFEVTVSETQWQKLLRMRELLSTTLPSGSWDEVLEYVAERVIEKKETTSKNLYATVHTRDKCCQYLDPKTKKVCGSKWNLQVDHIHPKWDGGANEVPNLRLLCANHNRFLYRSQANIRNR